MFDKIKRSNWPLRENVPMKYRYGTIVEMLIEKGQFERAETHIRGTLKLCFDNYEITHKHKNSIAIGYGEYGNLLFYKRNYDAAQKQYEKALEIFIEQNTYPEFVGITYANLGAIREIKSDYIKAVEYWTQARSNFLKVGDSERSELVGKWLSDLIDK